MGLYELAILGTVEQREREALIGTLGEMTADFDLVLGTDVVLLDTCTVERRDKRAAFAAAYFGGDPPADMELARMLVDASAPIIPTVSSTGRLESEVPDFLRSANGLRRRDDDHGLVELASAMLECVGLLRRQRRVFVSYRRAESRAAALQLNDLLSARGFDVFLDTHRIRPGDTFQDVLWHRLVDSDVLVMLDTPGYFASRWTRQEIGRARAKEIHVLRVIWPDHQPSRMTDLAETVYLEPAELLGPDGPIAEEVAESVLMRVESLRSRSIASRYLSITGKLRADVAKIGGIVEGIGAHRAIALRLDGDRKIWAYPVVGVPTAEMLNDVADKARRANQREIPVLVYDHVGIHDAWSAHLSWLDEQIRSVRAIKVSEAGWALVGLED
jgi:hypothetical protein